MINSFTVNGDILYPVIRQRCEGFVPEYTDLSYEDVLLLLGDGDGNFDSLDYGFYRENSLRMFSNFEPMIEDNYYDCANLLQRSVLDIPQYVEVEENTSPVKLRFADSFMQGCRNSSLGPIIDFNNIVCVYLGTNEFLYRPNVDRWFTGGEYLQLGLSEGSNTSYISSVVVSEDELMDISAYYNVKLCEEGDDRECEQGNNEFFDVEFLSGLYLYLWGFTIVSAEEQGFL